MFSILIFSSCSSDDDNNNDDSTGIVGTWKITSVTVESVNDYNQDGTANPNILEETQCSLNDIFVFNTDGTGEIISDDYFLALDVEQDANFDLYYTYECNNYGGYTLTSTWSQEGNIITVESVSQTLEFTLSGNQLTAFQENAFQVPIILSDGGADFVLEDSVTTLTKI